MKTIYQHAERAIELLGHAKCHYTYGAGFAPEIANCRDHVRHAREHPDKYKDWWRKKILAGENMCQGCFAVEALAVLVGDETVLEDPKPVIPKEVVLDQHQHQVLSRQADGSPYRNYVLCDGRCGYLIGCGDAIETAIHDSCLERRTQGG